MPIVPVSLSGAANGKPIIIAATEFTVGTPVAGHSGTLIHQAVAGTETWDELWLWAANISAADRSLTIGWGAAAGVLQTARAFQSTIIAANSLSYIVVEGLRIQNSLIVSAIGTAANAFSITGIVNRITPDE